MNYSSKYFFGYVVIIVLISIIGYYWLVPVNTDTCQTNSDGEFIDSNGNIVDLKTCESYIQGGKWLATIIFGIPIGIVILQMLFVKKQSTQQSMNSESGD